MMHVTNRYGWIEVICGSMFSGKSEELIRRVRRAYYGKIPVQVFKPAIDDRYHEENVVSHTGNSVVAVPMTVAPRAASVSAMAAPMPRLAPVTRAISPFSSLDMRFGLRIDEGNDGVDQAAGPPRAASRSAGVAVDLPSIDLSMRLARPVSTLPGPHSTSVVAPMPASACTQRVHCTGR